MRLAPRLIEHIAETVIANLLRDKKITVENERMLVGVVENIITADLEREDELNEEVRDLLKQHYQLVRKSGAAYDDLFRKIKKKLAEEKGIVL